MKKTFTILIAAIAAMMITLPWKAVGQTRSNITYTFSNASWNSNNGQWTNTTNGDSFESASPSRGIAKSKATINGTSPAVLSNVSSITVVASANKQGPTLTIYKVVDNTEVSIYSATMANENNKSYTVNLTGNNIFSGKIKVVLASSSDYKSVWIKSVAVTYTNDPTITIGSPTGGTITVTKTSDGSPISTGTLAATTGITLNATPSTGYSFTTWNVTKTSDGTAVSLNSAATVASNSFSMPSYNTTVNATFTKQNYNVTLGTPADADLTATDMDEISISAGGTEAVPYGTELVLEAKNMGSGKMFAWKVTKTGVTPEVDVTSTVLSGITATDALLTVPDYAVTVSGTVQELEYIVTYKANGGVGNDVVQYYSPGANVTAANNTFTYSGHVFNNWNTKDDGDDGIAYAEGATISSSISADITLYAQWFDAWTVTLSSNGSTTTREVEKTQSITLSSPASVPSGFVYKGWTGTPEYPFNMVSSDFTPTKDTTLYAVFAKTDQEYSEKIVILDGSVLGTGDDITESITRTSGGIGYSLVPSSSNKIKRQNITKTGTDPAVNYFPGIDYTILIGKKDAYIKNTTAFGEGITKFEIYANKGASASVSVGVNFSTSTIDAYNSSSDNTWSATLSTLDEVYDASSALLNASSELIGAKYFWYQVTNGNNSQIAFRITYIAPIYYTRVFQDETFTAATTINGPSIIPSGKTLNAGNYLTNTNADNLIIEEGGQIILNNDGVQATFKRNITPSTEATRGEAVNNWYAIATSTHDDDKAYVSFANVTNITPALPAKYNVYQYDEVHAEWDDCRDDENSNYDETFNELYLGRGYLFRTTQDVDNLSFKGEINISDVEYNLLYTSGKGDLAGFNFLGNPFSENITISENIEVVSQSKDAVSLVGGYVLSGTGGWSTTTVDEIAPNQGFLVQVNQTGYKAVISKPTHVSKGTTANNDYIAFTVANSQYKDITYAWFDKGLPLSKINHRNSEIPMIYISKDNKDFAIAMMDDDTQAFNLNFEAKTTGKYTLSFKANGEFNYLHVIDRLTGEDVDMLLEGEYSFIGSPMDNVSRFIVRLGYLPNYDNNGEDIFAYQSGSDVVVSGEGELQIFDVMGQMISTQRINGVETISLSTNGVYIFRLNGNTQKIVVK